MRLHRLSVRDFRGIREMCIQPLATGVTIVEGPNEAGKSSLIDALTLLLDIDVKANSTAAKVKTIEPAGRESGSEVEADLEIGDYRLTYSKRYNRGPATKLTIHSPRPDQANGDDAHERFRDIFTRHCDVALWDALRVQQAGGIEQAALSSASSLHAALEQAAGGSPGSDDAAVATLRDLVQRELERFYTVARFVPRDQLKAALDEERRTRTCVEELQRRLEEAERLAADVDRLESELAAIECSLEAARTEAAAHDATLATIQSAEQGLTVAESALREAALVRERAEGAAVERRRLIAGAEEAERERLELKQRVEALEAQLASIGKELDAVQRERERCEDTAGRARTTASRAVDDREIVRLQFELQNEEDRLRSIAELQKRETAARQTLGSILVDRNVLRELTRLSTDVQAARKQQEAGATKVRIAAEQEIGIALDGDASKLAGGSSREIAAASMLRLEIEGVASIEVEPPPSAAELVRQVRAAEAAYAAALRRYHVRDLDEAQDLLRQREEAERIQRETQPEVRRILRDLRDVRELREKYDRETGRLRTLKAALPDSYVLPGSITEAEEREKSARAVLRDAEAQLEPLQQRESALTERYRKADREIAGFAAELRRVENDAVSSRQALEEARATQGDDELERALEQASVGESRAKARRDEAHEAFSALNPERIRTIADNARQVVTSWEGRLESVSRELERTRSLLDDRTAHGLFEQAEDARAAHEHAQRRLASVQRQADAAKLLWETLEEARKDAHRRYAGPLAERIREFGRVLYGDGFDVDLGDDLTIHARTLDGITLPFAQLSGGAQEQLCLLARLATATLVDPKDGVPLIIDDALGYTDPERLRMMGAVLALAGRQCQVIVLTCYPGRYAHVGGAEVIRMP